MLEKLVKKLINNKKTISTMESCTGGALVSSITNVEGASEILKFSAITYSNQFKIKMGVSKDIIDKYSVYSIETAKEMSYNISKFTNSNYGVGITGKFGKIDKENLAGDDYTVFISIYDKDNNKVIEDSHIELKELLDKSKDLDIEVITNNDLDISIKKEISAKNKTKIKK